jgi:hypothetical protein
MRNAARKNLMAYDHHLACSFSTERICDNQLVFSPIDLATIRLGIAKMYPDLRVSVDILAITGIVVVTFRWDN